jgi:hypothetical protein
MDDTNYRNAAQQRVLLTLAFLAQRREGALPGEIAQSLGTLPSNTTRDLANLRLAGLAVARDGRWCCSPHLINLMEPRDRPST